MIAVAALAVAATARGEVAPVEIIYEPEAGCPDDVFFLDAVRSQTSNIHPPGPGEPARTMTVRISRADGKLKGRLVIEEIDGASATREVTGASCEEVASALALVTALAIDAGPAGAPPPSAPAKARPRRPAPKPPPSPAPVRPSRPAAPPSHARWELGAELVFMSSIAPDLAWGGLVFIDRSEWDRSGFAYAFRAAVALTRSPALSTSGGAVSFGLAAVRLSGCPLAAAFGPFVARPCAGLDAGAITGEARGVPAAHQETRPWIAPTLEARIGARIAALVIEVEGGLSFPLIRDRFVFEDPLREIHQVPAVGGFGMAGVGVALR